jgi:hypothetical protein
MDQGVHLPFLKSNLLKYCEPVLWIRKVINTVPHDLGDPEEEPWIKVSIFLSLKVVFEFDECCGSGSGRVGIIFVDADPYPFQPIVRLKYMVLFPENFTILSKTLKL